jgi:hypothetical protein
MPFLNAMPAISQTAERSSTSNAPMPTYIEEFFRSEAVRSEEKGELQSTLEAEGFRKNGVDADIDFEYGLTNRLQLNAELPYGIHSSGQSEVPLRWSTVNLGAEYQFVRSSHPFALTAGFAVNIPVANRGEFAWEPEILAAKQLGNTQLHASFLAGLGKDSQEYEYNLASVTNLHSAWFPTLEFNGRRTDAGANLYYLTPGIYRHFRHRVEAGAAVSGGSHSGVVGKITWEAGGDKD